MIIPKNKYRKIMIFGRPGSGKTTFAYRLHKKTGIPLLHLDKYFFVSDWIERDKQEFMAIQQSFVAKEAWIIDGNSIHSLETRWSVADLVLYFNFPTLLCLYRLIKRRFFSKRTLFDDRAEGCHEELRFCLIKYLWNFEKRVRAQIEHLRRRYPSALFLEIQSDTDLIKRKEELVCQ